MTSKHTQGPWTWRVVAGKSRVRIDGDTWDDLARVVVRVDGEPCAEGLANANLIAAAPDMYDTLKKLEYWLDTDEEILAAMNALERADHLAKLAMIRAAIAKAEGRA